MLFEDIKKLNGSLVNHRDYGDGVVLSSLFDKDSNHFVFKISFKNVEKKFIEATFSNNITTFNDNSQKELFNSLYKMLVNAQNTDSIVLSNSKKINKENRDIDFYKKDLDSNDNKYFEWEVDEIERDRLIKKYNILFVQNKRCYILSLAYRRYDLENTSPVKMCFDGQVFIANTWGNLLLAVCSYLYVKNPNSKSKMLDYSTDWTNAKLFSDKNRINHKYLTDGIYVNCNHTSLHCVWALQDILSLFEIKLNEVELLIHRQPRAEKKEVQDFFKNDIKSEIFYFLTTKKGFCKKYSNHIIHELELIDSIYKCKFSSGLNSLFLFDNYNQFTTYKKNFVDKILSLYDDFDDKIKLLNYLTSFYGCFLK